MDRELRRLIVEIISLTLLLIIVVPICVNASAEYREKKEIMLNGIGTSIDITHNGEMKKVTIYSNYDKPVQVNLIMKISKFLNDYEIYLDEQVYMLDDLEFIEDEEYLYYQIGVYEVNRVREFDFKLKVKGIVYYDEVITYSFMTEGIL